MTWKSRLQRRKPSLRSNHNPRNQLPQDHLLS